MYYSESHLDPNGFYVDRTSDNLEYLVMIFSGLKRSFLVATLLTFSLGLYAQTTTLPTGQNGTSNSLNKTTLSTGSQPTTTTPVYRSVVVPSRTVDLFQPSAIERMFDQFHDASDSKRQLRQYGYETFAGPLPTNLPRGRTPEPYVLGPGDVLSIFVWGNPTDLGELSPQYTTKIEGDGTFFYPPVGQMRAEGLLRADAEQTLALGLAKKYKRFDLRLQVSPQRVFPLTVTGLVAQPGLVMVDPWTSISEVLAQAGGIEKTGTLRNVKLVKGDGREVYVDLYDLLVRGKRTPVKLEEGDVLFVGPVGKTVAIMGNVKIPGIFELKSDETFADLLGFAGGLLSSAVDLPGSQITRVGETRVKSALSWKQADFASLVPADGDLFLFDSEPSAVQDSREKLGYVKVGGEVKNPGFFPWTPGMTLSKALDLAGGPLGTANSPGLMLTRASVVAIQRQQINLTIQNNKAAIESIEAKLKTTTDTALQGSLSLELAARTEAMNLLMQSLDGEGLGRILVDESTRGDIVLQPGDSITLPKDNGSVLVLGEVYSPGAHLWNKGLTVGRVLETVGGVSANGSSDDVYVIRVDGRVDSVRAKGNFLGMSPVWGMSLQSGDIVYAPIKRYTESTESWAKMKDVFALLSSATTTVSNVFVVLSTLGLL